MAAFTPNQFLNNTSGTVVRDYQHAARLFVDDNFRLLPKQKFLFHVAFNINPAALTNINLNERHRNEINMLVKGTDLPKINISAETLNQYNRKKNIYSTAKYNPINITFHDDNMGVVNQMWQAYYNYYLGDQRAAQDPGGYTRNATKSFDFVTNKYGLDTNSRVPFFNYITIYQMALHEYVSYKLINPVITEWNHNKVDYKDGNAHDMTCQVMYESVAYNTGKVEAGTPEGFGLEHYDQTPSPLQGGIGLTSTTPSFASTRGISGTELASIVTRAINTYQNTQELATPGPTGLLNNIKQTAIPGVTGLQGFNFPTSVGNNNNITVATQVNIGQINIVGR